MKNKLNTLQKISIKYPPKIFISYRRKDSAGSAGRLYDYLSSKYGEANIYKDVVSINECDDYIEKSYQLIDKCDIVIVLIGHYFAKVKNESGFYRIKQNKDIVREEILRAKKRQKKIFPIYIDDAENLKKKDLPADLEFLITLSAYRLLNSKWKSSRKQLFEVLEKLADKQKFILSTLALVLVTIALSCVIFIFLIIFGITSL